MAAPPSMSGGNQLRVAELRVTSVTVIPFGAAGGAEMHRITKVSLFFRERRPI